MKKYLDHPIYHLKQETYLTFVIILGPLLYFLSGINLDMYAPSLPAIANYFQASIVAAKNTMSAALLGWSCGAYIFGVLIDSYGRKRILLIGMFFYVIFSAAVFFCTSIHELILCRFFQNLFMSTILGSRVMIADLFSGRRYMIAMLYTTVGYGLGPIVGPFIGGFLQYYLNWQANFYIFVFFGLALLISIFLFMKESIPHRHPLRVKSIFQRCYSVLSHKQFMVGVIIAGITQLQLMIYPTVGPFIVEEAMHHSPVVYGNSALLVGAAYLIGSLLNRFLLRFITPIRICDIGFVSLIVSLFFVFLFAALSMMDLTTLMLPFFAMGLSVGFIFPNVLGMNLKQFAHTAGIAISVQSGTLLCFAAFGIFCISHIHVLNLWQLGVIFLVINAVEFLLFYGFYRSLFHIDDMG